MREQQIDPKELKTLSDILALVLEEHPGQAASALEAARARAKRNGITGGALKNLLVAIAPNPPAARAARPRTPRAPTGTAASTEVQALRTRVSHLTADVSRLDLDLRGAHASVEALRAELNLTRQARAEAQMALHATQALAPRRALLIVCALIGLVIGIAGTSAFFTLTRPSAGNEVVRYIPGP
ncbi:MAG: hypothetical protein INR65_04145 [Gluconacetobacter diazotrophicus]|nr:hypothetical protein [Gluconacetobacter diazotrophicus]